MNLVTKGWGHTHGWFQGQEILERLESRGLVKVDLEAHPKFYRLTKKGLSVYRELKLD